MGISLPKLFKGPGICWSELRVLSSDWSRVQSGLSIRSSFTLLDEVSQCNPSDSCVIGVLLKTFVSVQRKHDTSYSNFHKRNFLLKLGRWQIFNMQKRFIITAALS